MRPRSTKLKLFFAVQIVLTGFAATCCFGLNSQLGPINAPLSAASSTPLPHAQPIEHGKMNTHTEKISIMQRAFPYVGSLALTGAIFVALPLTQWASGITGDQEKVSGTVISMAPPPPPPQIDPPEEEEIQEEELQLKKETMKLSLNQIDLALNAGTGGMSGTGLAMGGFDLADDFADDLVFDIQDLDEQPKPLIRSAPRYPSQLKRMGVQGKVWIIFIVDENGNTGKARVIESAHPEFSESAIEAVQSWKFEPGKKGGKAVKTRVRIPLSFSIRR